MEGAVELRKQEVSQIRRVQLPLLKNHLEHALHVPFYEERLRDAGLDIKDITSVDDLSLLPSTTRSDLDNYRDRFGTGDEENIRDLALTSGTTGKAVIVPYTENDLRRLAFNEAVCFYGAGLTRNDRLLLTATLDRCFIAGLAYYSGANMLGATVIRSGPGQPERQWNIIKTLRPRVIVGVPSFLYELGLWGLNNGIDIGNCPIDTIVTIGEPVRLTDHSLSSLGKKLQDTWSASLISSYGATEFETGFCECREGVGGHVHPELMLVEVVDEEGKVLPEGQSGEVVVTPLGVEGFPLVRLRTGDVARYYDSPCGCGWNTRRLGAVEGRLAQRLKYRGTTFYPETVFNALQELTDVSGAYVEVRQSPDGSDDVTVVAGVNFTHNADNVKMLEDRLQGYLRVRPTVVVRSSAEVEEVMRRDGGRKPKKFFDFRKVNSNKASKNGMQQ